MVTSVGGQCLNLRDTVKLYFFYILHAYFWTVQYYGTMWLSNTCSKHLLSPELTEERSGLELYLSSSARSVCLLSEKCALHFSASLKMSDCHVNHRKKISEVQDWPKNGNWTPAKSKAGKESISTRDVKSCQNFPLLIE